MSIVFKDSTNEIDRASHSIRAATLSLEELKIEYIDHPKFSDANSIQLTLESVSDLAEASTDNSARCLSITDKGHLNYRVAVLQPAAERELFLRMNCLRFLAERRRVSALARGVRLRDIRSIENLLRQSNVVRNQIVVFNQRLLISIAAKLAPGSSLIEDLIAEGNLVLMRAVERFDVSRGFRFSTYATLAIRRHLLRILAKERKLPRASHLDFDDSLRCELELESVDIRPRHLVAQMLDEMTCRERRIVELRFGLDDGGSGMSLREVADVMQLSSERVRQILTRSLRLARSRHAERLGY